MNLREALSTAFDAAEEETEAPAIPAAEAAPEPVEVAPADVPDDEPAPQETQAEKAARVRDEQGRFAKAEKTVRKAVEDAATKATPPVETAPAPAAVVPPEAKPVEPPKAPEAALKAPQSWKPLGREVWSKLPPEAQAEIHRREQETQRFAMESAEERKFASSIKEAIRPFESVLHVNGLDAPKAVNALLRTAYILQTGTPQQKAQILAQEFKRAGIDEATFVAALDGTGTPAQGAQTAALPPEVAQIVTEWQAERQRKAQETQAAQAKQLADLQAFVESHEFADKLIPEMSALANAYRQANDGRTMSTEAVYARALLMAKADPDSEVGEVLRRREEAKARETAQAATQKAKAVASPKSRPAVPVATGKAAGLRGTIEAAWDESTGRT